MMLKRFGRPFLSKEDLMDLKNATKERKARAFRRELRKHFFIQKIMQESLAELAESVTHELLVQDIVQKSLTELSKTIKEEFFADKV